MKLSNRGTLSYPFLLLRRVFQPGRKESLLGVARRCIRKQIAARLIASAALKSYLRCGQLGCSGAVWAEKIARHEYKRALKTVFQTGRQRRGTDSRPISPFLMIRSALTLSTLPTNIKATSRSFYSECAHFFTARLQTIVWWDMRGDDFMSCQQTISWVRT